MIIFLAIIVFLNSDSRAFLLYSISYIHNELLKHSLLILVALEYDDNEMRS